MQTPILLQTLKGQSTQRPPVWFMRQAGRVLPNYMALKEKYTFWQMMQLPDIAAKVTLMPVDDLGVDAAILFSDILVIPHALGMGLDFTDEGPLFEKPLAWRDNPIADLKPDASKLEYIYKVIDEIVKTRPPHIPLIGFCGSPLTVLLYMLQGLSRKQEFPDAVKYMYRNKNTIVTLVDRITDLSIEYAKGQIKHGVDVFQLFETHAGLLPWDYYMEVFMPAVKRIAAAVRAEGVPFIYFPKGPGAGIADITPDVCDFLSIDWQTSLEFARKTLHPEIGVQGNLDPRILYADKKVIEQRLTEYLDFGRENQKWIFNLGHGFLPDIPYENAKFMADWVKNANWR